MTNLNVGRLTFDLTVNDAQFQAGMRRSQLAAAATDAKTRTAFQGVETSAANAGKQVSTLGQSFKGAALGMAAFAAAGAVVQFMRDATTAASDLGEALNMNGLVFETQAGDMEAWARKGAEAFGLSTTAALQSASSFGNLFLNVGVEAGKAAEYSQQLVEVAADMASAFNTTVPDAIQAMSAGLRGEAEPLRRYGVMLDDVTLKAKALEMGLYSGTGVLGQQAKALAAQAIIMEKTARIQGDFQRTISDPANAARVLQASVENLQAKVGEEFLPIYKELLNTTKDLVDWVGEHMDAIQRLAKVALIIGGITLAWKGVTKAIELATAAQAKYNAMSARGGVMGAAGKAGIAATAAAIGLPIIGETFGRAGMGAGLERMGFTDSVGYAQAQENRKNGMNLFEATGGGPGTLNNLALSQDPWSQGVFRGLGYFGQGLFSGNAFGERVDAHRQTISDLITGSIATEDYKQAFMDITTYVDGIRNATGDASLTTEQVLRDMPEVADAVKSVLDETGLDLTKSTGEWFDHYRQWAGEATELWSDMTPAQQAAVRAANDAATAQDKVTEATKRAKVAQQDYRAAVEEYRSAFKSAAQDALNSVDAFGGDPTDPKNARGQKALLEASAASKAYLKQQAFDVQALKDAGLSDRAVEGLLEEERANPGTIRKAVAEGITRPFVEQLNKDFRARVTFSRQIAAALTLKEADAKDAAFKTWSRFNRQLRQAARDTVLAEATAAATKAYADPTVDIETRRGAGAYLGDTMYVRNMTVVSNSQDAIVRATRRGRKSRNSAGRRG